MAATQKGFQQKRLPFWLQIPNQLSKSMGILTPKLTPEALTKKAAKRAGLEANFSTHVENGLEALCKSLQDDAKLNWFGKMNYMNMVATGLSELLLLKETFRANPELSAIKLNNPVFVTGMPRSGTTFLHRLLSASDKTLAVLLYQHMFPTAKKERRALRESKMLFFPWEKASKQYNIDAIHFVRPGLADECNFGMRLGMHSMIYWSMSQAHGYLNWLLEQDLEESYQIYRMALQLHQAKDPEKQLMLKCPHHLAFLPALTKVFPEATIVETHREPAQVVASECKLNLSIQALSTDQLDWEAVVKSTWHKANTFASRAVAFADMNANQKLIHVDYKNLVKDPVSLAKDLFQQIGISLDATEETAFRTYFGANKQHKHGKNEYSLEQFGLSVEQVHESFKSYRERFILT